MLTGLIFAACLVVICLFVVFIRSRMAPTYSVAVNEIPEVVSQLQRSAGHGHFAVLMFVPPSSTDGESVNLQYSTENGIAGLDWILIGAPNIADKAKVIETASKFGYRLEEREMNEVPYLRMTGSGISELGLKIITDLYKIDPNTRLDMITEGFKWESPVYRSRK